MLEEHLKKIQEQIHQACTKANRTPETVTLIAVSKTHPPELINEFVKLGVSHFGENKIQEAKVKIPLCHGKIHWHGIGHIQTNKARDAVALFDTIHSVDSLHLAETLQRQAEQQSRKISVLLEINISGEKSKFGLKPEEAPSLALAINSFHSLELRGVMTLPPFSKNKEDSRPYFKQLKEIKKQIEEKLGAPLPDLSMGMSNDFDIAIEEGATFVRIGTALFGERKSSVFRTHSSLTN